MIGLKKVKQARNYTLGNSWLGEKVVAGRQNPENTLSA